MTRGRLLSVRLAAEYLGVGYTGLRNAIARKEITVQRHPSGRLAGIFVTDCEAWIARRDDRATEPSAKPDYRSVDERMEAILPPMDERIFSRH